MQVFVTLVIPILLCMLFGAVLAYFRIHRPVPIALGSALAQVCVVSADEIREYCDTREELTSDMLHISKEMRRQHVKVVRQYIGQMGLNTKLFQQVARFEQLKIDPAKSSLDYATRETLALRLADEAAAVRWHLVRTELGVTVHVFPSRLVRQRAISRLRQLMTEYKQLEQDVIALVSMATDDCYYAMLVERLGLSGWGLLEGGASGIET
jgi:hypothetical protein